MTFERTSKVKSFWWGADISTDYAARTFKSLFNGMGTDYPKSPRLVKRILQMTTSDQDIVLDFFAGFSTTAQSVIQLNAEDGGLRRFIMVQLPELCAEGSEPARAGYKTISELSRERIRRAANVVKSSAGGELNLDQAELPDLGFKS